MNEHGHRNVPVDVTANTAHGSVDMLGGWSLRESAAVAIAATVRLRVGSAAGQILAVIELAANGSDRVEFLHPVDVPGGSGVYVEVVAGTVDGVLWHRA